MNFHQPEHSGPTVELLPVRSARPKNMKSFVKSIRISPRKIGLVADSVRNMNANQAIGSLSFVQKRGAKILAKAIKDAVANAVNSGKATDAGSLVIDRLVINQGSFLKRFKPSTRGRVHPYKKRSTNITVLLKEKQEQKTKAVVAEAEAKK